MSTLKHRLSRHGFTSNEDYDYPVQCLLAASLEHLRCLNVVGECGRRKTAFAHALAHALGYAHVLYHEFAPESETPPPVRIAPPPEDEEQPGEAPVEEFDRIVSEACALSEGEKTILILDQIQLAPFKHHLRLTEFISSHNWSFADSTLKANAQHLLLFMISEEALYHSLQQLSFNIWVDAGAEASRNISPEALGLGENARGMLESLQSIFQALNLNPTLNEYKKVIHDIHVNINGIDDLKTSIYGWVEGTDRGHLMSGHMQRIFETRMPAIIAYLGLEDATDPPIVFKPLGGGD